MNAPAPEPKPKRPRRMILWMVAVPIAILLLALAGANWKFFHLAYAKQLMRSTDREERTRSIDMVLKTHLRVDMSLEEVRRLLAPASVTETDLRKVMPLEEVRRLLGPASATEDDVLGSLRIRQFTVSVEDSYVTAVIEFDQNDRLRYIGFIRFVPRGGGGK